MTLDCYRVFGSGSPPRPTPPHSSSLPPLSWPSSSILGSSGARFAAGLADATSHWPSSTILTRRLAGTGRSPLCDASFGRKVKTNVASLCFKCFRYFIGMLQVCHVNVVKVDQDVAYVAMVVQYVPSFCSQCFICFLDICCKCVIWMLHMFHT
jgi:hypothetical protein